MFQHQHDQIPGPAEDMEALRNGLMNIDNAMAGVNQQVAGLANFRAQTDQQLQNITANLTHQSRLQSAVLLPSPFSGHTGQNAQRFIDEINQYADYTAADNIG